MNDKNGIRVICIISQQEILVIPCVCLMRGIKVSIGSYQLFGQIVKSNIQHYG